jgi:BirA family transcriptional regulator, biotin operon repressor / biotin---[acetyl-CoA-carboxylase] ligase
VDVALRRPDGHTRDAGDLLVRQPERVAEHHRRPLVLREPGEGSGQVTAHIGELRSARGIALVAGLLVGELEWFRLPQALAGDPVAARVDHQAVQPRRELRLSAELLQAGTELDEGLLGCIPCFLEVTEELGREPVHPGGVALDEHVERALVSVGGLRDELHVREPLVREQTPEWRLLLELTRGRGGRLHGGGSLVVAMPDSLAPAAVEPVLGGRFGRPYLYKERCSSSQVLLDPSLNEGATAVCDHQTAGRGRLGRSWETPPGTAILCSVLLRPPSERRAPELSLVGGLAAAEAVERATNLAAQIKWPNDVMLNRRKVAGVLAEAADGAVVLGIGLNVNQTQAELPAETTVIPASLRTVDGVRRQRAPILVDLLGALERAYERWCEGGLEAIYEGLGARDFLRGRKVIVDGQVGYGVAIDRNGRLEIDLEGDRRLVESGEVFFER